MKLLLIEDNPTMQATLQRTFEQRGMQVLTCRDGARARAVAGQSARRCAATDRKFKYEGTPHFPHEFKYGMPWRHQSMVKTQPLIRQVTV